MHAPYLREKAREMRREKNFTIDQIAERLALPRTTIYYWVKDLPIPPTPAQEAYAQGRAEFDDLARDLTFRDFVSLYLAEGSKRNRNTIAIRNSDAAVLAVALVWLERMTGATFGYRLLYHADQNVEELKRYWAEQLRVEPDFINVLRKSNSNQMKKRTWRSRYGVLTIVCHDTLLRARLQAWMDRLREEWLELDSA